MGPIKKKINIQFFIEKYSKISKTYKKTVEIVIKSQGVLTNFIFKNILIYKKPLGRGCNRKKCKEPNYGFMQIFFQKYIFYKTFPNIYFL